MCHMHAVLLQVTYQKSIVNSTFLFYCVMHDVTSFSELSKVNSCHPSIVWYVSIYNKVTKMYFKYKYKYMRFIILKYKYIYKYSKISISIKPNTYVFDPKSDNKIGLVLTLWNDDEPNTMLLF